jgi:hypothetical protein
MWALSSAAAGTATEGRARWKETPPVPVSPETSLLERSYAALNARSVDAVLATMRPNIDWPDMLANRRIVGLDAVRECWQSQFEVMDPSVTPTGYAEGDDGQVLVDVHQVVRDQQGNVLSEQDGQHAYVFRDGLAAAMDVYHGGGLASAPRTSSSS